jgi:hypothetical protein
VNLRRRARSGRTLPCEAVERLRPHFPDGFDFTAVRIRDGIPRWAVGRPSAVTFGETIYFAPGHYAPATNEGVALLAQELAHVAQFRALGTWRFAARYLAAYFTGRLSGHGRHAAYWNIPFERAARDVEIAVARRARSAIG